MLTTVIFNIIRSSRLSLRMSISTCYTYIFCYLYGVKLSKGCKFWNRTTFYLEKGSKIEIGVGCLFRSDTDSNLIGVNHRCIVSTHSNHAKIVIGNNSGFSGTSIGIKEAIEIGNNVLVGANSIITDFDWHSTDPENRDNPDKVFGKKIIIEDNVWIGANSIILKGVHIGPNTIIGAGSVVVSNQPGHSICAGNPCKVLKSL